MPLLNGLDAARKIEEQLRNIKFVFLTMRDDPNLAAVALELELGSIGFVLKHSPGQESDHHNYASRPRTRTAPTVGRRNHGTISCLIRETTHSSQSQVDRSGRKLPGFQIGAVSEHNKQTQNRFGRAAPSS